MEKEQIKISPLIISRNYICLHIMEILASEMFPFCLCSYNAIPPPILPPLSAPVFIVGHW